MTNQLLITEIQSTLNNLISKIEANSADFSLANWKTLKGKLSSSKLASLIQLNEGMLNEFEEALRQFYTHQNDSKKGRLACLRVALWLETITKNMSIPFEFEKALSSEEIAIKQVRALELIIRDVITEQLGGKENVILKLQELFKQDVIDKWIKSADQSGILSGTTFSELSNILLDKNIFKGIEEIFHSSEIELSKSTRDSLRYILEDIRVIRNAIAHNKKVSNIQIEALNEYYKTIADILKNAKKTQIDPDTYLDLSKSSMEDFISSLKEDNKEISGNIESIKKSIDTINVNIGTGFSEIKESNQKLYKKIKSISCLAKVLVFFVIASTLWYVPYFIYLFVSTREINTRIQLTWLSEKSSYKFQEIDKLSIQTGNFKGDFFINSSGIIDLTDIPSENLNKQIILCFKNSNIFQVDTPLIVRNGIIPIRVGVKNINLWREYGNSSLDSLDFFFFRLMGTYDKKQEYSRNIETLYKFDHLGLPEFVVGYSKSYGTMIQYLSHIYTLGLKATLIKKDAKAYVDFVKLFYSTYNRLSYKNKILFLNDFIWLTYDQNRFILNYKELFVDFNTPFTNKLYDDFEKLLANDSLILSKTENIEDRTFENEKETHILECYLTLSGASQLDNFDPAIFLKLKNIYSKEARVYRNEALFYFRKNDSKLGVISLKKAIELGFKNSDFFINKIEIKKYHSKILDCFK